jgi:hypothetical protein
LFEEIGEIFKWNQIIRLGGLDNAVDHSAGSGAPRGVGEQEVLPAYDEWSNRSYDIKELLIITSSPNLAHPSWKT